MLKEGDRVVIAISGGPDSVSLLLALNSLKKKFNINLSCAHLNHLLRGQESDKDERYVKRLADNFSMPLLVESKDAGKLAKEKKLSLEQAARELRYDFLLRAAKKMGASKIAMGHTKDDQAETLLMRLLRGAGLRGLRAIPPMRKVQDNIFVIRPLIETSRKQITSYLKRKKIRPRLDSTNAKTAFLRNRLRHKLLPAIERYYSPKIKDILARTANVLDADYGYLLQQQQKAFRKIAKIKTGRSISLPIEGLRRLAPSLKRGMVRLAIESIKGDLKGIDYRHWERIEDLIEEGLASFNLPGGIKVVKKPKTVLFKKNRDRPQLYKTQQKQNWGLPLFLQVSGKTPVTKRLAVKSSILKAIPKAFNGSPNIEYFDFDKIKFPLMIRYKRPSDRMKPLGMKRYKRLQDIFIDDKVKLNKRAKIPIIVDAKSRIVWVCGIRMSEDFKMDPQTKKCLRLSLIRL